MDEAKFYWTVVAALFGALWTLFAFIRDRRSKSVERSNAVMTQLLEANKLSIENPDIQKYISQNAVREEEFFRSKERLNETIFYQAKTFVYARLNSFDEILSISSESNGVWDFLLKPAGVIELDDWKEYMIEKLRHPFYRSILINEGHIFGEALRDFWISNTEIIDLKSPDPYMW